MYWQQQYYNAIMRSAMNHHFQSILREKGYTVSVNEDDGQHKIDSKKLKEEVKEANNDVIERAINDNDESLTADEKKIKISMEKRANILHIAIDNDQFRKELADETVRHASQCM
jgi:hypothetical protein